MQKRFVKESHMEPIYDSLKQRGCEPEGECVLIAGMPVQFLPAYNPLLEEALAEAREEKLRAVMTLQRMAAPILGKRGRSRRLWIFSTPA
jgi:hypothetical protein